VTGTRSGSVMSVGGMSLVDRVAQYDAEVLMCSSGGAFRAIDAAVAAPPGRCFPALAAAPDGSVSMFGGCRNSKRAPTISQDCGASKKAEGTLYTVPCS
jgi:hypothetical protein